MLTPPPPGGPSYIPGAGFSYSASGLGYDTVLTGVPGNEPLLPCLGLGAAAHQIVAVDGGNQTLALASFNVDSATSA